MSPIPTLRPLGETLGTEVCGINLATALDAPTIAWIHMWTAPSSQGVLQCFDQIACVHMSGLWCART
jgi:hypothetical protein